MPNLERAKRAIDALRKPDHSLANVANTIRQSIAEVIEDLMSIPAAQTSFSAEHVLDLLQCSSCFRGDVCASMPCACAQSIAHAHSPAEGAALSAQADVRAATIEQPRVIDFDDGEISVRLNGKELRGWSYKDDPERRTKMLCAREYVEGWCDGRYER